MESTYRNRPITSRWVIVRAWNLSEMKENLKISTLEVFRAPLGIKYCQRNLSGPSGRLASLRSANCDLINFRFLGHSMLHWFYHNGIGYCLIQSKVVSTTSYSPFHAHKVRYLAILGKSPLFCEIGFLNTTVDCNAPYNFCWAKKFLSSTLRPKNRLGPFGPSRFLRS